MDLSENKKKIIVLEIKSEKYFIAEGSLERNMLDPEYL